MNNQRIELLVENIVEQAVDKYGVVLPTGETVQTVKDWALSDDIDRDAANQTQRDKDLHKALGATAKSLQGSQEMRKVKGTYAPLVRFGKWFFTATHKITVPQGAKLEDDGKTTTLVFDDEKAARDYVKTTDEHVTNTSIRWVDPVTGDKVKKTDLKRDAQGNLQIPKKTIRVNVQNRTMEMADSRWDLAIKKRAYDNNTNYTVSAVRELDKNMNAMDEITPVQISRLINSVTQSTPGTVTAGQQAIINGIRDAYARQLSGRRAAHMRLKRHGVAGFSNDIVKTTLSSSRSMAGHLANLKRAPQMAKLEKAVQDFNYENRFDKGGRVRMRERIYNQVKRRITTAASRNEESTGSTVLRNITAFTAMRYLFSPSYWLNNATQVFGVAMPTLSARHGIARTNAALLKVGVQMGAPKTYARGIKEMAKSFAKLGGPSTAESYAEYTKRKFNNASDKDAVHSLLDKLELRGYGTGAGFEAQQASWIGKGTVTNLIDRMVGPARAMGESIEAVNRFTTAIAAMRLATEEGMSPVAAEEYAISMTEKTQGGYSSANNPTMFSNPYLSPFGLGFKKYAVMYGNLYYGAMSRLITSPGERKLAAKELIGLSMTSIALAGTNGVAFLEVAAIMAMVAYALGLDDDDWEDWENSMQAAYADVLGNLMGKEYAKLGAEALARGLTRLPGVAVDTSKRLGNSSMVLFSAPEEYDEAGVKEWLATMILGPAGQIPFDTFKAVTEGKWEKLPLPKFMTDIWKAKTKMEQGTVNRYGRQVAPEIGWADVIRQSLGYTPASQARQWELGGSGTKSKEKTRTSEERTAIMQEWVSGDRKSAQKRVREWNKTHGRKERIDMSDLLKSKARRRQLDREQRREMEASP